MDNIDTQKERVNPLASSFPTKRCTKCGGDFPATPEWFRVRRGKLFSQCRGCERAYHQTPERKAIEKNQRQSPQRKAYDLARRQSPEHKAYMKAYCQSPKYKAYKQSAEYKAHKRAYAQSPKRKAYDRARGQSPERKADKRANDQSPKRKAYRRSSKYKMLRCTSERRRNAQKRALAATFTVTDWQRALEYFNYRCAVCGRPRGLWHTLAQDHWIPLNKGGTYTPDNIVPLCHGDGGCNNSKSDQNPQEWLIATFGKSQAKRIVQRIEHYFVWVLQQEIEGGDSVETPPTL